VRGRGIFKSPSYSIPESERKERIHLPCPHCKITIIKQSNRESAVSAAAHQSGEKLFSEYGQEQKYYPCRNEVTHKEKALTREDIARNSQDA